MAERPRSRTDRLFRTLLRAFPFDFRADHGRDMEQTFRAQQRDADGTRALVRLWWETIRDVFMTAPGEHLAILRQDASYALRALRRTPGFTASAVLTLALGMSAVTGMLTIVNAVMLRPLPVDHPEQLISISNRTRLLNLSFPDLRDYRRQNAVLTDAAGYQLSPAALNLGGSSERIVVEMVTDNYFSMLGVQPAAGRLIHPDEGRARGDAAVLVLAHDYWRARFDGDPSVVGRTIRLNGHPFTVIGVAASGYRGPNALVRTAAWVPAWMFDAFMEVPPTASILEDRGMSMFNVLARMKPGVSLAQAQAALDVEAARLAREYPSTHKDVALRVVPETHARPTPEIGPFLRVATTALTGLALVLLLITSANVTSLLMARAASRGREVALRAALGARRGRIARQLLTEALVLSLLSGALAVPLAVFAVRGLRGLIAGASSVVTIDPDFSIDLRVLAVTFATAITAGIVSGLAPALLASRVDVATALKSSGRGASRGPTSRLRHGLIVAQVALSLALLVSGGLFVRSLDRARDVDLGFDPEGLFLASASPGLQGYTAVQRLAFYRAVRERVAALPGIERAAWISRPPLGVIGELAADVSPVDRPADPEWKAPTVYAALVSSEYFATAGVRLVNGRAFDERDAADAPPVVIVNETLATRFYPGRNAIGRTLRVDGVLREVVGVVQDGKYRNVWETPEGAVFKPLPQEAPPSATVVVRSARGPSELAAAVRRAIQEIDPDVAIYDVRSMAVHLDNGSAFLPFRAGALITTVLGGMGVLLAAIGLYGMLAYHVSQRTSEIGVRMALGARAADILRDVMWRGARFAGVGITIGVVLGGALALALRPILVGVSPFDPLTYTTVAVLLLLMSLVASFVPARRAIIVDPLVALRTE